MRYVTRTWKLSFLLNAIFLLVIAGYAYSVHYPPSGIAKGLMVYPTISFLFGFCLEAFLGKQDMLEVWMTKIDIAMNCIFSLVSSGVFATAIFTIASHGNVENIVSPAILLSLYAGISLGKCYRYSRKAHEAG